MEAASRSAGEGQQYEAQHLSGVAVELRSQQTTERQMRVIGATWLDKNLGFPQFPGLFA
jgi:hypothetical protein